MTIQIALIGFGEVGTIFAQDLIRNGASAVSAYDLTFDGPDGPARHSAAQAIGVRVGRDASDACRDAAVVISAVTADAAEIVAREAATFLQPGQIYLDINSAAPSTKRRSADVIAASGRSVCRGRGDGLGARTAHRGADPRWRTQGAARGGSPEPARHGDHPGHRRGRSRVRNQALSQHHD